MTNKVHDGSHNKKRREPLADKQWRVAIAAYYLSEKRGFAPGKDLEDWLKAESLIKVEPPETHHRAA
jgi:hypothetical protein